MPPNAALRRLLEEEAKAGMYARRVLGVPVWALERSYRYRVLSLAEEGSPAEPRHNTARSIAYRFTVSVKDLGEGAPKCRPGRDIWVLSASNYRRRDERGVFQCAFAEHLRDQLSARLLFIERNQAGHGSFDRPDVMFVDAAMIGAEGVGRVLGPLLARSPLGRDAAHGGSAAPTLCGHAIYGRITLQLARRWVRRARPTAVFVLNGYHMFIPFQMAAREAGVPVIELQHGIIHESHPGYVFPDVPEQPQFPDHLVVFGRQFGELLERECPRWRGRWSVGGHPWLRRRRAGIEAAEESSFDSVVVFSQPHQPVREQLKPLLQPLRRALPASIRLLVKPHPRELDVETYYRDESEGIEFAGPRDDTYTLLRRCRVAVSVYSTVAMEALAFRCRSAILPAPLLPDDFRALVSQGAITMVDGADAIAALAALPPPRDSQQDAANRLFGVLEPEPDFTQLIERLHRKT